MALACVNMATVGLAFSGKKKSRSAMSSATCSLAAPRKKPNLCLLPGGDKDGPKQRGRAGLPPPIGGRLREVRLRKNLTLGARGQLPIESAHAPAAAERRVRDLADRLRPEGAVCHRPAFPVGVRVDQIALRGEIAVGVGP